MYCELMDVVDVLTVDVNVLTVDVDVLTVNVDVLQLVSGVRC